MELSVPITSEAEWATLIQSLKSVGAAMVTHDESVALRPGLKVVLVFTMGSRTILRANAEVIHLYASQAAVQVEAEDKARLEAFDFASAHSGSAASNEPQAMWKRYERLTKPEKLKLARQGNADARRRILKDRDNSLHLHVLNNPGLKPREISSMVRSGFVNPDFLKRIVARKDLISNHEVVDSIINNPHTPIPIAVSLLPRLRLEAIRRIAKQGRLRDAIVKAARKRVISR